MIIASPTRVRLSRGELNSLRQAAARNGVPVNRVETPAELLQATLNALPPDRAADLLEFLETGSSALSRAAARPRGV